MKAFLTPILSCCVASACIPSPERYPFGGEAGSADADLLDPRGGTALDAGGEGEADLQGSDGAGTGGDAADTALDASLSVDGGSTEPDTSMTEACTTVGCPGCAVEPEEACDDENTANGDGCNPSCSLTTAVTTVASGFETPWGVATDGTSAFLADHSSCAIFRVDLATGSSTLLAGSPGECEHRDGAATEARFDKPTDLVMRDAHLFVLEQDGEAIRKVDASSGATTTLDVRRPGGGDDPEDRLEPLDKARGIASAGEVLLVSDTEQRRILTVNPSTGVRHVIWTGEGKPRGLASDGTTVWAVLHDESVIVSFPLDGDGSDARVVAGSPGSRGERDGIGGEAKFDQPNDLGLGDDGSLYVAEEAARIRQVELPEYRVTTLAGDGESGELDATGVAARFQKPRGIAVHGTAPFQFVLVTDGDAGTLRRID